MDSRKKLVLTELVAIVAIAVSVLSATTCVAQMRIDVDQAVDTALQNNWGFKQNEATIAGAAASRSQSLVSMLPSASGSYTYQKSKTDDTGKNQPLLFETDDEGNPTNVLNSGDLVTTSESGFRTWSVSFREDLSFSQWYNYKSAGQNVDAAHLGREAAAQDLAYTVRSQFYLALRAEALLVVQNEDFDLAQNELDRTQTMYELGSVPKVDVYKAEARVADAEVALIRQRNAVELEHARLATLLGMQPNQRFDLVGDLSGLDSVVDSTQALKDALGRPDLRQAEMNLRAAGSSHRASKLSRVPGVFASFNIGGTAGTSEAEQINYIQINQNQSAAAVIPFQADVERDTWNFSLGASVALDALLNTPADRASRAQVWSAEYALEDMKLNVSREAEEAILNLRASASAIVSAQRGVDASEEDLRLNRERYQQGLGTILELLQAQVDLTRARYTLVNAQTELKIAKAALDKARGLSVDY